MKLSKTGLDLIKSFEGCHLKAYKCPAGVWTCGYGSTAGVTEHTIWTQAQAEDMLKKDVASSENAVNKLADKYDYNLTQGMFDALVSFTFNCGVKNLETLTAHGSRPLYVVGEKLLLYVKANGVTLKGLERRRKAEYDLFFSKLEEVPEETPTAEHEIDTFIDFSKVKFRTERNFRIRQIPSTSGKVIGNTTDRDLFTIYGMSGEWVKTDAGWIHKTAFYDEF